MTYQALYRRWRPNNFSDFVGQEHIVKTLRSAIVHQRLAHAYLFCGPRGTGKTSMAKILAKAVNCHEGTEGEPCSECQNCLLVSQGKAVDVLEIDAASNRGIDEIRDLREKVRFSAVQLKHKVYIIDEVHMMTTEAFNALLKTLEEPPAGVMFIMATTEPYKLPKTILSRCQRFDFYPLESKQIIDRLKQVLSFEGAKASQGALELVATGAEGGMRDALSILEQCLSYSQGDTLQEEDVLGVMGQAPRQVIFGIIQAIARKDAAAGLELLHSVVEEGYNLNQLVKDLVSNLRDVLLAQIGVATDSNRQEPYVQKINTLLEEFQPGVLAPIISQLHGTLQEMKWSSQPRLLVEMALINLCQHSQYYSTEKLASRIKELEEKIENIEKMEKVVEVEKVKKAESHNNHPAANQGTPPPEYYEEEGSLEEMFSPKKDDSFISKKAEKNELFTEPKQELRQEQSKEDAPEKKLEKDDYDKDISYDSNVIEELKKAWPQIMRRACKKKQMLKCIALGATPDSQEGRVIKVKVDKDQGFALEMLESRGGVAILTEEVSAFLGKDYLIKLIVNQGSSLSQKLKKEKASSPATSPEEFNQSYPSDLLDPCAEEDDYMTTRNDDNPILDSARDMFNGKILE